MNKKLIQEISRIKELSKINEEILNEDIISDIKHFFEIASDEIKQTDVVKKLKEFYDSIALNSETSESEVINDRLSNMTSEDDEMYKKILSGIGAEWNPKTKLLMYSWRRAESGTCKNNPFNTKQKVSNVITTCCNKECVKNYPTVESGVKATVDTLINGKELYNYDDIIEGLKTSNSKLFFNGLKNSSWGTSGELAEKIYKDYIDGVGVSPTPISK